jgi:hypothetical protein
MIRITGIRITDNLQYLNFLSGFKWNIAIFEDIAPMFRRNISLTASRSKIRGARKKFAEGG